MNRGSVFHGFPFPLLCFSVNLLRLSLESGLNGNWIEIVLKNLVNYLRNGNALMSDAKFPPLMSFNLLGGQDPRSFFQVLIFTQHVNNLPGNCLSTGDRRHPVGAKIPKTKGSEH